MKLVLATNNEGKVREFARILEPLGIEVMTQKQAGVHVSPEENGTTFAENARIKAMAVYEATGLPTVADDSGLCIDAMNGEPGVYSARYYGEDTPYEEKNRRIIESLNGVAEEKRTARFVAHITCVLSKDEILDCEGVCEGTIGHKPAGDGGFGYDPIFYVGDKSFAELDGEAKDKVSHRGKALEKLYQKLTVYKERKQSMLTSKESAKLRTLANPLETILQVGKGGIGEQLVKQVDDALRARELIKMRVLETAPGFAREIAQQLAEQTDSEVVQVIGTRFVLYRKNKKDPKIIL